MNTRNKRILQVGTAVALLSLLGIALAKADDDDDIPTGPCGEGQIVNPLIAQLQAQLAAATRPRERTELEARLARLSPCVAAVCPDGFHRDPETGECVKTTPETPDPGFNPWDPGTDGPIIFVPPACPAGQHLDLATMQCVDDDDIEPWIKDFPEGNAFYKMRKNTIVGWGLEGKHTKAVTQNMLARELLLAAKLHGGMDGDAALAWATARRRNTELTNHIYNAIQCAAFNDYTMGTWGYCGAAAISAGRCPASMRNHPGDHGRALRPLPMHADNLVRLRAGLPAARVVSILTPNEKGNGRSRAVASAQPGGNDSLPTLWLPGVDRKVLWESNGQTLVFLAEQANPPDFIMNRGILDLSGSTLTRYGCGYGEREF